MNTFIERFKIYYHKYPVTAILILLNTAMLLVVLLTGGFSVENLVRLGGLVPSKISNDQEYYRLLTSMFLHGSIIHFLANTYFLYQLGSSVETLLGKAKYILIYFLSGFGASLLVWWLGEPKTVTIGASGALFGILGSIFLLTYLKESWFSPYSIKSIRFLVFINLIFTVVFPNISVLGHLGGFATGLALMRLFLFKDVDTPPRNMKPKNTNPNIIDHDDITDDDIFYH